MSERTVDAAAAIPVAAFRSALRAFLRTSEEIARANGLTPQRHLLLLMIKGAPDGSEHATVSDLAEQLQLSQSTVTELVRRAEDVGLVERERSHVDGRVAHLRLTAEGERRLARVFRSHDAERQTLRAILADLEQGRLEAANSCAKPARAAAAIALVAAAWQRRALDTRPERARASRRSRATGRHQRSYG
jgi:DNA-binding MarR family transcriptional regulator